MSLYHQYVRKVNDWLEKENMESIKSIIESRYPKAIKNFERSEVAKRHHKDQMEIELAAIRHDLGIQWDEDAIKGEISWATEDMRSERCTEYMKGIFLDHIFECSALLKK